MITVKAPASSANLGPGFDCLGIAFDMYNTFTAERCDKEILENVEKRYQTPDNLFLQAYRRGLEAIGIQDGVRVRFDCDIPVSRGLGSSASIIAAGLYTASALHDNALSRDEIFQLASRMEGHPDNAAAAVLGGLSANLELPDGKYISRPIPLHSSLIFTVLVPDFEVTTESARKILPASYSRQTAASNSAKAVMMIEALKTGDFDLMRYAADDQIHQPYRRKLIHGYDAVEKTVTEDTGGILLISGSGSACLLISGKPLSPEAADKISFTDGHIWNTKTVHPAYEGTTVTGGDAHAL